MGAIEEYFSHDVEERSFEIGGRATSRTSRLMDIAAEYENEIMKLSKENEEYRRKNALQKMEMAKLRKQVKVLQSRCEELQEEVKEHKDVSEVIDYYRRENERLKSSIRRFNNDCGLYVQTEAMSNVVHNHLAGSIYINQSDVSGSYVLGSSPESIERFKQLR